MEPHHSSYPHKLGFLMGLALLAAATSATPARAATSGQNGLHDPSRMMPSAGKVYVYATGGRAISSSDGLVWASSASPPWHAALLPNNQGIWAPDGIFVNGQWYIYYAMWSSDKSSAVALLTSPSLDPAAAKWTDGGVAVSGPAGVTHSVIDPGPVLDAQGNLWVVWGGGYPFNSASQSIFVTRMDNATGLPLTSDPGYKPPNSPGYALETGHKEGPAIYYHAPYYYLFWQTGNAFNPGTGYSINMARAMAISGPYSGDRTFYSKNPAPGIYGPGHMGIYSCNGVERFTYHFYSNDTNSGSALGENTLTWGSDGWPVPGPVSTTPFVPCNPSGGMTGGAGGASSGGAGGASAAGTGGLSETGGGTDSNGGALTGGNDGTTGGDAVASGGLQGIAGGPASGGDGTAGSAVAGTGAVGNAGAPVAGSSAPADSSSGCGCRLGEHNVQSGAAGMLLVGIGLTAAARRRRRSA